MQVTTRKSQKRENVRMVPKSTRPTAKQISSGADNFERFLNVGPAPDPMRSSSQTIERHKEAMRRAELIQNQLVHQTDEGIDKIIEFAKPALGGLCANCDLKVFVAEILKELRRRIKAAEAREDEKLEGESKKGGSRARELSAVH